MKELSVILPEKGSWEAFSEQQPLIPFCQISIEFTEALSSQLLQKCKEIHEKTLKFVATNQSLYV